MEEIEFIKMHGLGNDFVVIDARARAVPLDPALLRAVADRRLGIGFDQLIRIEPARNADSAAFMRIYNADGSEVDACGNATRCIGWLLMSETGDTQVAVETNAGRLVCNGAGAQRITVDMGVPAFGWQQIPLACEMDSRNLHFDPALPDIPGLVGPPVAANIGNPHCIFFVSDVAAIPLSEIGPLVEHHALFPARVNVSFAEISAPERIRLRVWERGVGITRACGTAACAVVAAAAQPGVARANRQVCVALDGGMLAIDWRADDNHIYMTGETAISFRGRFAPEALRAAQSTM